MKTETSTPAFDMDSLPELQQLPEMDLDEVIGGSGGGQPSGGGGGGIRGIISTIRDVLFPPSTTVGILQPTRPTGEGTGGSGGTIKPPPAPPKK